MTIYVIDAAKWLRTTIIVRFYDIDFLLNLLYIVHRYGHDVPLPHITNGISYLRLNYRVDYFQSQ